MAQQERLCARGFAADKVAAALKVTGGDEGKALEWLKLIEAVPDPAGSAVPRASARPLAIAAPPASPAQAIVAQQAEPRIWSVGRFHEALPHIRKALLLDAHSEEEQDRRETDRLLTLAFLHGSVARDLPSRMRLQAALDLDRMQEPNYQRLEFYGDAAARHVFSLLLFGAFPTLNEGQLAEMREALERRSSCAQYLRRLRLDEFVMRDPSSPLTERMMGEVWEAALGAVALARRDHVSHLVRVFANVRVWESLAKHPERASVLCTYTLAFIKHDDTRWPVGEGDAREAVNV